MAFERLNPVQDVWRRSGLKYILDGRLFGDSSPSAAGQSAQAHAPTQVHSRKVVVPPQAASAQAANPSGEAFAPQAGAPRPAEMTREDMPRIWRERLEKTRPGFAAWTYAGLSRDLEGSPVDEVEKQSRELRKNFMQALIRELAQPAGTHAFWPCLMPENGIAAPNPEAFWAGLRFLGCKILFIFGADALAACGLSSPPPAVFRACYICALDELEKLAVAPGGKLRACALMKSSFQIVQPDRRFRS